MLNARLKRFAIALIVLMALLGTSTGLVARAFEDATGAGTVISNRAEATYQDETGESFTTVSPTVTVTVSTVAAIVVTPDETVPSDTTSPRERITRVFTVCNTGNNADSFTVTRALVNTPSTLTALYFDTDGSGTLTSGDTAITIGDSASPQLQPGGCIGVLAVVDTNDSPAQSTINISLTARSNAVNSANGRAEDSGTIINLVGAGARLTDPTNASLPPSKLVDNVSQEVISAAAQFTYTIAFRNQGDVAARNVIVVDQLLPSIEYIPGSLELNTRGLSDAVDGDEGSVTNGKIEVRLARVDPGELVRITFRAQLAGTVAAGTGLVNFANITSDNTAATKSVNATVVVNPFGLVFAGRAGGSAAIPGARVDLLTDPSSDNFVHLPGDAGFAPNAENKNPFSTDGLGHFSFVLGSDQVAAASSAYFMRVAAAGYLTRMIELHLHPAGPGLFALSVHALDSQPLAEAGGFNLVREDVTINDLAALVLNIPMFEASSLQITKSADRAQAQIGDVITYRVDIHNPTAASVSDVVVRDRLPASFHYAASTGRFNLDSASEQPIEPQIEGNELRFRIAEIPHGGTAHLLYRVTVGVNAGEGNQENVAQATGVFPSGERAESAQARASVQISAGVFSTRQVIVGRVFVDENGNGQFDAGDKPAAGVRLYLSNGQSVITDSAGLYNFPSLGDGSQVISLDPVTVPNGFLLSDGHRRSNRSWSRLLRTPVGGGTLLRQNFALVPSAETRLARAAAASKSTAKDESATKPVGAAVGEVLDRSRGNEAPGANASSDNELAKTPKAAGTYEMASTEAVERVAAGSVKILSPAANAVVMSAGLQLEARVAMNWTVKLEVNGREVSDKTIGIRSLDHKNQVSTFTFVGLNLKPGPNRLRLTPINSEGEAGHAEEMTVMGRGPARRLEIVTEKPEIQTGGNDFTLIRVKAFDQWGNPALDGQVGIASSLGQLKRMNDQTGEAPASTSQNIVPPSIVDQAAQANDQLVVQLDGGEASLKLIGAGAPGEARLRAQTGEIEAEGQVRITTEDRPTLLVGFAEMSFGKSIPEVGLRGETGNYRGRVSLFYNGRLPGNSMLTLSYDSQRPINRTAGRDRIFQLDPVDRVYPLFGDSSTRLEAAQSNSKLYARIDHRRSYAMFGDFEADMEAPLTGYARKLTGVKVHLENSEGDFVTVGGARPDTTFARDVFPAGSLGLLQLSNGEILPGSESVVLEIRDRRNPEVVISRETMARSVDYNLDAVTGQLFFLRYISTFDSGLNLTQIVVTYEHRAAGLGSAVYTARGRKNFKNLGLKLGFSTVLQNQTDSGDFFLGGIDAEKKLPHGGSLQFAWARSQGEVAGTGNALNADDSRHDGNAYQIVLAEPLPFFGAIVRARYLNASAGFLNPFGATITPGSRRGEVSLEMKPRSKSLLRFGVTSESNHTDNVDNSRLTYSAAWDQILNERIRVHLGFDHRSFTDDLTDKSTDSNLVTAGADLQLTDKLQVSVKREQNLGDADPTYPTQTTIAAAYQVNALTKLFLTQRFAAAPIMPIGDFSGTGFAASSARRETAFGVETRFGKWTSMVGRYQIENAINGTDSFAVVGLQNRLPLNKQLSLEVGFERGFHLLGPNQSFNSGTIGLGWQPNEYFRASARYEYRDRGGLGQLIAAGAAGRISDGVTALSRFQFSQGDFNGKLSTSLEGTAALAIRPLKSDRVGLLFSYTHRSLMQTGVTRNDVTRDRVDSLSADGYNQVTKRLELYGRFALRFNANGQPQLPFVSTLTFLTQARAQYLLTERVDVALETRLLFQPSSGTTRSVYATEAGFWALTDLRLAGGYNFTAAKEPAGAQILPTRRGFYFTITSKLSNLFDLFGTSRAGLASSVDAGTPVKKEGEKK